MTDRTSLLTAPFRCPPEDAHSTTVAAGREAVGSGNPNSPVRSHDVALGDVPGKIVMTRHSAADIVIRAALSQTDQCKIIALPYPVGYQVFWQMLAEVGVTQERLMDRMGASP